MTDRRMGGRQPRVDFLSLSFVRRAEDVLELRQLVHQAASEVQIVAKIEKPEALSNLEGIIAVADARHGGPRRPQVEVDIAEMAVIQKRIVKICRALHKPVIIATQMLDSMPTRGSRPGPRRPTSPTRSWTGRTPACCPARRRSENTRSNRSR